MHSLARDNGTDQIIIELKHFFMQHTGSRICYRSFRKWCFGHSRPDVCLIFQPVDNFLYNWSHKHESYDEIGTAIIGKSAS